MKNFIIGLTGALILSTACSKEEVILEEKCSMTATVDDRAWCGTVFETFFQEDFLVINASKASTKVSVDSEQITIYIKNFDGTGTYPLTTDQGVYREWFQGDLLVTFASVMSEDTEASFVTIESYDVTTSSLMGTFEFTASGNKKISVKEGVFTAVIQ